MLTFLCYKGKKIIGTVDAVNGDMAWELTKMVQPDAEYIRPLDTPLTNRLDAEHLDKEWDFWNNPASDN